MKAVRVTRSKVSKNPLQTQKFEAQTEIIRNNAKNIENANEKMNYSDDEDDKQMKSQLQKEQNQVKEKKKPEPEFYTEQQLDDMRLLFGMPEEEIQNIIEKQNKLKEEIIAHEKSE